MKNECAGLFDFDGTLTKRSTVGPFFIRAASLGGLLGRGFGLAPSMARYVAGRAPFQDVMALCSERLLAGLSEEVLAAAGDRVARSLHEKNGMWSQPLRALEAHLERGERVAIVTGGYGFVARAWLARRGIECDVFSSELLWDGDRRAVGAADICVGEGKLRAVTWAREHSATVVAYGNSSGDFRMLETADAGWWVDRRGRMEKRYGR